MSVNYFFLKRNTFHLYVLTFTVTPEFWSRVCPRHTQHQSPTPQCMAS